MTKLLQLGDAGSERAALRVSDDYALDVHELVGDDPPGALMDPSIRSKLTQLADGTFDDRRLIELAQTRIGPCIPTPSQILGVGLNFADHATESGADLPTEPVIFNKSPHSLAGPNDPILIPEGWDTVDWEVEIAVVIGRRAEFLAEQRDARDVIAGYCLAGDISDRDRQLERGGQWMKGKSAASFCPVGPFLVAADAVKNVQNLRMATRVNGAVCQESASDAMVFGAEYLVWYVSQFFPLEAGDLLLTGTPDGVGMGEDPPRYLRPGDVVEMEVEMLGLQRHACEALRPGS